MLHQASDRSSVRIPPQMLATRTFHAEQVRNLAKSLQGDNDKLSKRLLRALSDYLREIDQPYQVQGMDFSRAQLDMLIHVRNTGLPIEFETLGPYLIDYLPYEGFITVPHLLPEDAIGLELARVARRFFPTARLISLYDEYNARKGNTDPSDEAPVFSQQHIQNFRASLITLLKQAATIPLDAIDTKDFLLIPESCKVADAELLVKRLDERGYITRNGNEVTFTNEQAENPLYRRVRLRTKQGRWLCEALDASAFLKAENQTITHLVILPSYMKAQQDKVWEVLRVLNISLRNYHNIFYDPAMNPQDAAAILTDAFTTAEHTVIMPQA